MFENQYDKNMCTNFVHIDSIHDYHLFSNNKIIIVKFIFKFSLDSLCVKKKSINKSTKKSIIKK